MCSKYYSRGFNNEDDRIEYLEEYVKELEGQLSLLQKENNCLRKRSKHSELLNIVEDGYRNMDKGLDI